jgi:phosphinothricin acetyltransferase
VEYRIEEMSEADWPAVRAIFRQGIETGHATFESESPDWAVWDAEHLPDPRFVARGANSVLGWVALSPVSGRCVYGGVAEVSLYVDTEHRRRGVGTTLLHAVIDRSEAVGLWMLQAGVFPENEASLALLEREGFRVIGRREKLGKMRHGPRAGEWRDVILLERRSAKVATD